MFISAINTNMYKQYNCPTKKNVHNGQTTPLNQNFGAGNNLLQIKSAFAKEGVNYLLPNEIWSDSKIEKAICTLDKNVKNLIKMNKLSKKNINEEINKMLPKEKQNSIKIFDITELKDYFISNNVSEEEADKIVQNCGGMQIHEDNVSKIFVPINSFLSDKNDKFNQLNLRMSLAHEVTHSLQAEFQNEDNVDMYHHKRLEISDKYKKDFFNDFEEEFYYMFDNVNIYFEEKELNEKNFYKYINVKNEKELFKDFDKTFDKLLDTKYRYYNRDRHNTKQFYTYCKNKAHNEKIAYKTSNIMSELNNDKKCNINYDYRPFLYNKIEKYFDTKAKNAQAAPEETREYKFKNLYG